MLIAGLPADAAVFRAMPDMGGWALEHHLLAVVADRLAEVTYALVAVNTDKAKRSRIPQPHPLERPGMPRRKRRGTTVGQLQALAQGGATDGGN